MRRLSPALLAPALLSAALLSAALIPVTAVSAADETNFGFLVGNIMITKTISLPTISLKNVSPIRTVEARKWFVPNPDPMVTVTGQVFCKDNARLVAVQAVAGPVVVHANQATPMATYGSTPKDLSVAGRRSADVSLSFTLKIARDQGKSLANLNLSPAAAFESKMNVAAAGGGSRAAFMRDTRTIDIPVRINLIAWCKGNADAGPIFANKTYAGVRTKVVPMTVLYDGDPRIVDGIGVRAAAGQNKLAPPPAPAPKPGLRKPN